VGDTETEVVDEFELTASEKLRQALEQEVPDQELYDRQQLKNALAAIRQQLAQETVLWYVSVKLGRVQKTHPKQQAAVVIELMKQETLMVELLEGELPLVRPEAVDADEKLLIAEREIVLPGHPEPPNPNGG
jgi:hypothetical protein